MTDHAATIRALRAQSNDAIAARDPERVVSFLAEEVLVRVAGGPVLRGRAANRDAFASQMAEPAFAGYVRTPSQITVHADPLRATELGQWVGRWRAKGRLHEQGGHYRAEWQCSALGWSIVSETYLEGDA